MANLLLRRKPLQSCACSAPLARSRVRNGGGRAPGPALREVVGGARDAVVEFWSHRPMLWNQVAWCRTRGPDAKGTYRYSALEGVPGATSGRWRRYLRWNGWRGFVGELANAGDKKEREDGSQLDQASCPEHGMDPEGGADGTGYGQSHWVDGQRREPVVGADPR